MPSLGQGFIKYCKLVYCFNNQEFIYKHDNQTAFKVQAGSLSTYKNYMKKEISIKKDTQQRLNVFNYLLTCKHGLMSF